MASYTWSGPTGGNWSDPANWTPNGVPGDADTALVNLAGSYAIALDVASIGSLTLDAPGVTITPGAALTLGGVLDVQAGTFVVGNPITGGTMRPDGGTIDYAGGTLDGVTLAGPLDLGTADASVNIKDGITFIGTGPEQILVTGANSSLGFDGGEILNDVAIVLGGSPGTFSDLDTGSGLTLGAGSTLTINGLADVGGQSLDNQGSISVAADIFDGQAIVTNQGSIAVSGGNTDNLLGSVASNTGTISVSGTGTGLTIGNAVNSGSIDVSGGATLSTEGTLDNTSGTINLASGATLDLGSTETEAQLGNIQHNGASVVLGGTVDNTNSTLDITKGSLFDGATFDGTIRGGTVELDGGTLAYSSGFTYSDGRYGDHTGTLDGVTLDGPLDLSADDTSVLVEGGITFSGIGPEQILVTGADSNLSFDDNETLDDVAVVLGGSSGNISVLDAGPSLTLSASSTLTVDGDANVYGGTLDNQGMIVAASSGFLDDDANINNQGSIAISDGSANNQIDLVGNNGAVSVSGSNTGLTIINAANFGSIDVSGGATLTTQGYLENTSGTITLDASSSLDVYGTVSTDQLGSISRNGASLTLGGTLDNTGRTLDITKGNTLDGATLTGTVTGGTIRPDGGALDYAGGVLNGVTLAGPLDLSANGASVSVENGITFSGTTPGQILDTGKGSTLSLQDAETLNNVAITLGSTSGNFSFISGAALTLASSSTLTIDGAAYLQDQSFDNKGSITAVAGDFTDYANFTTNEGAIAISNGDTSNYISNLVSNTGTISVSGSRTDLTIASSNNFASIGATSIADDATLTIADPTSTLGTVSFLDNTGTLSLTPDNEIDGYGGTLNLFQSGDAIDLYGTGYSLSHVGNTLTLSQDGSVVDSFALTGQDYSDATFTLTASPGGTILTTDAPCFCAGTLILTDRGERVVEALEVGDLVVTRQDGVDTLLPIRWLGHRRVVVAQHPEAEHVDPICIARDAIAPGVPARDLHVSPDHALHLDGMLIQARQLVNGMTITRDAGRAVVTYHHVELDRHAILIADGMPCESYLDGGNRGQFDSQGIVVPLHPPIMDDAQPCASLVTDAARVRPVWQRLVERAHAAGHVAPAPELEPELLPWLETTDGTRLLPCGDGLRFALPPGCTRVRLRSASDRPAALAPWSDDRRRLGVAVRGLTLCRGRWRQEIALNGPSDGWWPVEHAGDLGWRWTDGDGHIELPEPAEAIEIILHATMPVRARSPQAVPRAVAATAA